MSRYNVSHVYTHVYHMTVNTNKTN